MQTESSISTGATETERAEICRLALRLVHKAAPSVRKGDFAAVRSAYRDVADSVASARSASTLSVMRLIPHVRSAAPSVPTGV